MLTDNVILQVFLVLNGNTDIVELIHNINCKDAVEAVVMNSLPVFLGILTRTAVCRATFHNSTVYLVHEVTDEGRLQVMRITTFTCGNLHGNTTVSLHAKGFVNLYQ